MNAGAQYRRRRARDGTARTPRSGTLGPYDATVHRSRAASFPPGYAGAGDLPTAKPEQVGLSSERLERIAQVLRVDVERGRIPGAVVVVARKGRVALQAVGFRDKATGAPMTPDAIFRLASMTKPIVTVAALSLYEEGRLLLSDPVSKYIPTFKD